MPPLGAGGAVGSALREQASALWLPASSGFGLRCRLLLFGLRCRLLASAFAAGFVSSTLAAGFGFDLCGRLRFDLAAGFSSSAASSGGTSTAFMTCDCANRFLHGRCTEPACRRRDRLRHVRAALPGAPSAMSAALPADLRRGGRATMPGAPSSRLGAREEASCGLSRRRDVRPADRARRPEPACADATAVRRRPARGTRRHRPSRSADPSG